MIVTVADLIRHLRLPDTADQKDLLDKLTQAQAMVLDYLARPTDSAWTATIAGWGEGSPPDEAPAQVEAAILEQAAELYQFRGDDPDAPTREVGSLSPGIKAKLYRLRQPVFAWKTAPLGTVPCLWPGSTIVCLGTGPSLTAEDVAFVQGKARVIAISNAVTLAPWADCLYSCDSKWWKWHKGVPTFTGLKYSLQGTRIAPHEPYQGLTLLKNSGRHGLSRDAGSLRTGHDSGMQAINLARHFGAIRIGLLGFDYHDRDGEHFFGSHPDRSRPPFAVCLKDLATLPPALAAEGITVINCSPGSALRVFPTMSIAELFASGSVERAVDGPSAIEATLDSAGL